MRKRDTVRPVIGKTYWVRCIDMDTGLASIYAYVVRSENALNCTVMAQRVGTRRKAERIRWIQLYRTEQAALKETIQEYQERVRRSEEWIQDHNKEIELTKNHLVLLTDRLAALMEKKA